MPHWPRVSPRVLVSQAGVPHCVSVDYDSLDDGCVTLRERDTATQRRLSIDELLSQA